MGLSCDELRNVTYPALMWLIHQYVLMNAPDEKDEEKGKEESRMATDADVRALMFM